MVIVPPKSLKPVRWVVMFCRGEIQYIMFRYPPGEAISTELFKTQRLSLTDKGMAVLDGRRNARSLIVWNEWLGGVHLNSDRPMWMWDGLSSQLKLA